MNIEAKLPPDVRDIRGSAG